MWSKLPGDSFILGLVTGIVTLIASYISLRAIRLSLVEYYGNPYLFPAPRIELICMLINILFFRIMIVNLQKEKTGRGILFITVILSVTFFFLFFKLNYRLP
jgi:hypothetical protein